MNFNDANHTTRYFVWKITKVNFLQFPLRSYNREHQIGYVIVNRKRLSPLDTDVDCFVQLFNAFEEHIFV